MALAISLAGAGGAVEEADAQEESASVDPITCWWKSSAGSVRVGEPFDVILTCAVVETPAVRVVVEESRLDPAVAQMPPFDLIGGRRGGSLPAPADGRRFFQYEYTLRLIAEQAFDTDVSLPPLQLSYRVEHRRAPGESAQGRELTYALPPLAMRIVSTVPAGAKDPREAPAPTFAAIERVAFRGTLLRVLAIGLFVLGLLLLARLAVGALRRRTPAADTERDLPVRAILAAVRDELREVRAARDERSRWTPELAARALVALRIAASHAAGQPIAQQPLLSSSASAHADEARAARATTMAEAAIAQGAPAGRDAAAVVVDRADAVSAGQLLIRGRLGAATLVSGSMTAGGTRGPGEAQRTADVDRAASTRGGAASAGAARASAGERPVLREALARFDAVRYGRDAESALTAPASVARLDEAMAESLQAVDRLAAEHTWIAEAGAALRARLSVLSGGRWTR